MRKIAFHILKGGTGKTSLSGNVAFLLSKKNKTVIVDCDVQGNITTWLCEQEPSHDLADSLTGEQNVGSCLLQARENLFILPIKKDSKIKEYSETKLFNEPFIFEDLNSELDKLGFKFAIYDLSPSISQLERCVLLSVDEVITPLTPEFFSYSGIDLFTRELEKINKSYRKKVLHKKIVLNNFNQSFSTHKIYLDSIKKLVGYEISYIPQDRKIADSQIHHKTIFEFSPDSKSCEPINGIVEQICQ